MINIPTISELYNDIIADLQAEFGMTIPNWGKVFFRALASVQAAKIKMIYLSIGFLQRNLFVDTADPEIMGGTLERFGRVKIGRDPYPATQGVYEITVTGLFGGIIPAGTTFKSAEGTLNPNMLFVLDNEYTLSATTDVILVRALTAGTTSRLAVGDILNATAPIINVDGQAAVNAEITIPNNAEDIEEYRKAVINGYRLEPQGGANADYILWAQDAGGVKAAYPYTKSGASNEVDVFIEATKDDSIDGKGSPTTTILNEVEEVIEMDPETGNSRRPLGVFKVNVLPVTINSIFIEIANSSAITATDKDVINSSLTELIDDIRPFIPGADVLSERNDSLSVNLIIATIISALPGLPFGSVTLTVQEGSGTPLVVPSKTFSLGNIPFLDTISYA